LLVERVLTFAGVTGVVKKTKPYKGYTATVEFDADEMVLHGRVDDIRDVVTFQASSADRVQPAFVEAVDDYLVLCDERGEEPDMPARCSQQGSA